MGVEECREGRSIASFLSETVDSTDALLFNNSYFHMVKTNMGNVRKD